MALLASAMGSTKENQSQKQKRLAEKGDCAGLQLEAVGHRHQAGLALGEAVAGLITSISVFQRCAKFFAHLFAQHFRNFCREIAVAQYRFPLLALRVDELHH